MLNAVATDLFMKMSVELTVADFVTEAQVINVITGARTLDVTVLCQNFLNSFSGFHSTRFARKGKFVPGDYNVTHLKASNYKDVELDMDGARFGELIQMLD